MAGLLGILLLLGGAGGVGAQQIDGLQQLEARLNADADNLEAGNSYRKAVIAAGAYDRALDTFKTVVAQHPRSANAYLNYGFAYVDKIPAAGSITQVILANSALTQFTKSIELQPTWIAYYTRGASYLFWPKIFGRASLGVADLQEALRIQRHEPKHSYHVRTFIALGDGYWKSDDRVRARDTWKAGLQEFPGTAALEARLAADDAKLAAIIDAAFDPNQRVDTDLSDLWSDR